MKLELVLSDAGAIVVFRSDGVRIGVRTGDVVGVVHRRERNRPAVRGRLVGFDLGGEQCLARAVGELGNAPAAVHPKSTSVLRTGEPAPNEPIPLIDPITRQSGQTVIMRRNLGLDLARAEQHAEVLANRCRVLRVFFPERKSSPS